MQTQPFRSQRSISIGGTYGGGPHLLITRAAGKLNELTSRSPALPPQSCQDATFTAPARSDGPDF